MAGEDVKVLQQLLREIPTGEYDDRLAARVRGFKVMTGITPVDAVVDDWTAQKLGSPTWFPEK
jgi:hypothetical protein